MGSWRGGLRAFPGESREVGAVPESDELDALTLAHQLVAADNEGDMSADAQRTAGTVMRRVVALATTVATEMSTYRSAAARAPWQGQAATR
jgi:hypothetical protein